MKSLTYGAVVAPAVFWALMCGAARANETDQFLMPSAKTFADLGPMINIAHFRALQDVVAAMNRDIDAAVERGDRGALAQRYDPAYLAEQVQSRFGPGFFEMMLIEESLRTPAARQAAGDGRITAYRNPTWIYFMAHLPVDPRNTILLVQSSTILVDGVYMGVDKWGHFHDLGNIYFQDYRRRLTGGRTPQEAQRKIVKHFSRGIVSEEMLIGSWATGIQSNGDLASNFAGFKFYCNLTEAVTFNGQRLEPLMVRRGRYWALNTHVRPDADFVRPFVTDHWNEALNPGRIEAGMRWALKWRLKQHAHKTLAFYSQHDRRPAEAAYYQALAQQLRTFRGEDYGHLPISSAEVTIANTCFERRPQEQAAAAGPMARLDAGERQTPVPATK